MGLVKIYIIVIDRLCIMFDDVLMCLESKKVKIPASSNEIGLNYNLGQMKVNVVCLNVRTVELSILCLVWTMSSVQCQRWYHSSYSALSSPPSLVFRVLSCLLQFSGHCPSTGRRLLTMVTSLPCLAQFYSAQQAALPSQARHQLGCSNEGCLNVSS